MGNSSKDEPSTEEVEGKAAKSSERPEDGEPQEASSAPSAPEPVGAALKKQREARGIELKEISERTRIGVRSLQAVEEERFEDLPNARVYVRGFVRCYAEEVGLDPETVAKSYLVRWIAWHETEAEQKQWMR